MAAWEDPKLTPPITQQICNYLWPNSLRRGTKSWMKRVSATKPPPSIRWVGKAEKQSRHGKKATAQEQPSITGIDYKDTSLFPEERGVWAPHQAEEPLVSAWERQATPKPGFVHEWVNVQENHTTNPKPNSKIITLTLTLNT